MTLDLEVIKITLGVIYKSISNGQCLKLTSAHQKICDQGFLTKAAVNAENNFENGSFEHMYIEHFLINFILITVLSHCYWYKYL